MQYLKVLNSIPSAQCAVPHWDGRNAERGELLLVPPTDEAAEARRDDVILPKSPSHKEMTRHKDSTQICLTLEQNIFNNSII